MDSDVLSRTVTQPMVTSRTVTQPTVTLTEPATPPPLRYDVAIVGGGIVGLVVAYALGRTGMAVLVADQQTPAAAAGRRRAYALSPSSQDILQQLGLWEAVAPHCTPFQRVYLSDGDHPTVVVFTPQDLNQEPVYYSADHGHLMAALQGAIAAHGNIHYLAPAQVGTVERHPDRASFTLTQGEDSWPCEAQVVVAAEGARSPLRQQAGIPTLGWPYWQSCITTVLAPAQPHQNTAYERFWPSGPFAILPLPNGHCQIVWTAPHAEAQAFLALPRPQFLAELQRRYGDQMGALTLVEEPQIFPVRLMQSRRYVLPRLALVGDAAHGCHPLGGQGLNMGIRDGAALAQVLIAARDRGEDLGTLAVLNRYGRWRQWENTLVLLMTDSLNRIFSNRFWPLVALRRATLWSLRHLAPLRALVLRLMTGRFGRLPRLN